jgi:hypothetical protein
MIPSLPFCRGGILFFKEIFGKDRKNQVSDKQSAGAQDG